MLTDALAGCNTLGMYGCLFYFISSGNYREHKNEDEVSGNVLFVINGYGLLVSLNKESFMYALHVFDTTRRNSNLKSVHVCYCDFGVVLIALYC